jgi:hypothetical protein
MPLGTPAFGPFDFPLISPFFKPDPPKTIPTLTAARPEVNRLYEGNLAETNRRRQDDCRPAAQA